VILIINMKNRTFVDQYLNTKATKDAQRTPSLCVLWVYFESFVVKKILRQKAKGKRQKATESRRDDISLGFEYGFWSSKISLTTNH